MLCRVSPTAQVDQMHIQYGYSIDVVCQVATPLITMIDVHPSHRGDITEPDAVLCVDLTTGGSIEASAFYLDEYENICRRIVAPQGGVTVSAKGIIFNAGFEETQPIGAAQTPPEKLPAEAMPFLLGSQYCQVEKLSDRAWNRFGGIDGGYARVQAVCDFVNATVRFGYNHARNTRTAAEVFDEGVGVCRDFAHLAITLCRALNIPARYCTGYLGDIGVPVAPEPMDFSAWFEVYLEGEWWPFDARHNVPRIGRIPIARGRDATDVPIIHSFGIHSLTRFEVTTLEVTGSRFPASAADRRNHHAMLSIVGDRPIQACS
jgi:transglutaminase-like putative cysteine protease